jgi:hypothetical protein
MDATNFQQTRSIVEIQRYPGNDGTEAGRGRDLILLGVERPFEINGHTDRYHRLVWPFSPSVLFGTQRCIGWDLRTDPTSPTTHLHEEHLVGFAVDYQTRNGERPAGNRIWWLNSSADPLDGLLPTLADVGIGCFLDLKFTTFLSAVHAGNPINRRNGSPNDGREAFAVGMADYEVNAWLDSVMFDGYQESFGFSGSVGVCSSGQGRVELFGLQPDGSMARWTRNGGWKQQAALVAPKAVNLATDRPGALCTGNGGIELFARGVDGGIWWQRMSSGGTWTDDWVRVSDAATKITSGIEVVGVVPDNFHLFARGEYGELRHAEFANGWTGSWDDLAGILEGTPTARIPQAGRIDVFVRGIGGTLWQVWKFDGSWQPWHVISERIASDPIVIGGQGPERLDLLFRTEVGTLGHMLYQDEFVGPIDTGVPVPDGTLAGTASTPGRLELFLAPVDKGAVWHATWPRAPK